MPHSETPQATGLLQGVTLEHLPALIALLCLPLAVWLFLKLARAFAATGTGPAAWFVARYQGSPLLVRATALLLLATGVVHLALVPAHLRFEPGIAALFAIDGLALTLLSLASFTWSRWRPAAAVLLGLTILAYLPYVAGGREEPDQLGITTKLIELIALGLVLIPRRAPAASGARPLRWVVAAAPVMVLTLLIGTVAWGASLSPQRGDRASRRLNARTQPAVQAERHHAAGVVLQPVPNRQPTDAERAAARDLLDRTSAGIAKYRDVAVALADGYRPSPPINGPTVHYTNASYVRNGSNVDPGRPAALVYGASPRGPELLGAMYLMHQPGLSGPDVGGPLTQWHIHPNLCGSPINHGIAGLLSPFGTCPAGAINIALGAALHVWIVANPNGPFSELPPR